MSFGSAAETMSLKGHSGISQGTPDEKDASAASSKAKMSRTSMSSVSANDSVDPGKEDMIEIRLLAPGFESAPEETFISLQVGQVQIHKRLKKVNAFKFPDPGEGRRTFGRLEVFKRIGTMTVDLLGASDGFQDIEVPCSDPGFAALVGKVGVRGGVPEQAVASTMAVFGASKAFKKLGKKRGADAAAASAGTAAVFSAQPLATPADEIPVAAGLPSASVPCGSPLSADHGPLATSLSQTQLPPISQYADRLPMRQVMGLPIVGPSVMSASSSTPCLAKTEGCANDVQSPTADGRCRSASPPANMSPKDSAFLSAARSPIPLIRLEIARGDPSWYLQKPPETPNSKQEFVAGLNSLVQSKSAQIQQLKADYQRIKTELKAQKREGIAVS